MSFDNASYLYALAYPTSPGLIKIGTACDITKLISSAPTPFTVIATCPSLDPARDKKNAYLHFQSVRREGKFFATSAAQVMAYFGHLFKQQFMPEFEHRMTSAASETSAEVLRLKEERLRLKERNLMLLEEINSKRLKLESAKVDLQLKRHEEAFLNPLFGFLSAIVNSADDDTNVCEYSNGELFALYELFIKTGDFRSTRNRAVFGKDMVKQDGVHLKRDSRKRTRIYEIHISALKDYLQQKNAFDADARL